MAGELSAKDVLEIIQACKDGGVRSFNYGDLKIELESKSETVLDEVSTPAADAGEETPQDPDLENELLAIENPAQWEAKAMENN
jgi:predicted  nucleic acid-binding Zn-ribbon protein